MIYNNLIYFLVVILVLTTNSAPSQPQLSSSIVLIIFIAKWFFFHWLLKRIYSKNKIVNVTRYTVAERQGAILAIVFFSLDVYLLDCQYYFNLLPLSDKLPVISSTLGIALFFFLLPTYLIRFDIGPLPTTLLEIMLLVQGLIVSHF